MYYGCVKICMIEMCIELKNTKVSKRNLRGSETNKHDYVGMVIY